MSTADFLAGAIGEADHVSGGDPVASVQVLCNRLEVQENTLRTIVVVDADEIAKR